MKFSARIGVLTVFLGVLAQNAGACMFFDTPFQRPTQALNAAQTILIADFESVAADTNGVFSRDEPIFELMPSVEATFRVREVLRGIVDEEKFHIQIDQVFTNMERQELLEAGHRTPGFWINQWANGGVGSFCGTAFNLEVGVTYLIVQTDPISLFSIEPIDIDGNDVWLAYVRSKDRLRFSMDTPSIGEFVSWSPSVDYWKCDELVPETSRDPYANSIHPDLQDPPARALGCGRAQVGYISFWTDENGTFRPRYPHYRFMGLDFLGWSESRNSWLPFGFVNMDRLCGDGRCNGYDDNPGAEE